MCDNYDYELISQSHRWVNVPVLCDCCDQLMPADTMMVHRVGLTDGEHSETNCCPACECAIAKPEDSALHLCWGWGWDGGNDDDRWVWMYIDLCLGVKRLPTEDGCQDFIAQRVAEESEE